MATARFSTAARILLATGVVFAALAAVASPVGASPAVGAGDPAPSTSVPAGTNTLPGDSTTRVTRGVQYATAGATSLTLDVFQPDDRRANRPAVVLVHGGAWFQGVPSDMDREGDLLARQGWVAFSINYRLARPGTPAWPGAVDDVRAAIWWVAANAGTYGIDAGKLALLGASAGGHLASLVATTGIGGAPPQGVSLTALPAAAGTGAAGAAAAGPAGGAAPTPPRIRAVAAWSPPVALDRLVPDRGAAPASCGGNVYCQTFWQVPFVPVFLGCGVGECPQTYHDASPANFVSRNTVPMWLANSTDEIVPLNQLEGMSRALDDAGVPHEQRVLDGHDHAYEYATQVWNDMMPFLATYVGVPNPAPIDFGGGSRITDNFGLLIIGGIGLGFLMLVATLALKHRWDEP